jgi:hypothetical protein
VPEILCKMKTMKPSALLIAAVLAIPALGPAQDEYSGPRPAKPDIPFLLHADNLVETEVSEASEQQRKNESTYTIPGAGAPSRTPLAEPIFLFLSEKIPPDSLELYRLEVKGGSRQITLSQKRSKDSRPMRLSVTRLADKLYRLEVNEGLGLPNGEYSITPSGSNKVFCFAVY